MPDLTWQNVMLKYQTCSSHSDEGRVTSNGAEKLAFTTHFLRPGLLRLEWSGTPLERAEGAGKTEHYVILALRNSIQIGCLKTGGTWQNDALPSLHDALAFADWSSGLGKLIPALLIGPESSRPAHTFRPSSAIALPSGGKQFTEANKLFKCFIETDSQAIIKVSHCQLHGPIGRDMAAMHPLFKTKSFIALSSICFENIAFDAACTASIFELKGEALKPMLEASPAN